MIEFEMLECLIDKFGLQVVGKAIGWDNMASPVGYGEIHLGTSIGLFEGYWDKSDSYSNDASHYDSFLNENRFGMLKQLVDMAPDGSMAEFGVLYGGVTKMMLDKRHKVYAFDTFEGIKGADKTHDYHNNGDFNSGDIDDYIKGAIIIKGTLPKSALNVNFADGLSFVHFDLDVIYPTIETLRIIWEQVVLNGIIVFDDYGTWTTSGVKKAVDNFNFGEHKKLYLPTGQMVIFKGSCNENNNI